MVGLVTKTPQPKLEAKLETLFYNGIRRMGGRIEKLAPTRRGIPDRLVLLPGGRMFLVELKTDTGRVRPAQKVWHQRAAALGTTVVLLCGQQEIEAWLSSQATPEGQDQ